MTALHGIILAAGISSRMGAPKALLPAGESYALHAIYEKLLAGGTAPVHIVLNTGLLLLLQSETARFPHATFVSNPAPALGQFHSLKLGLEAARTAAASGAMVALVDLPRIREETVRTLAIRAQAAPEKLLIPSFEGKHGHPIVIPAPLFERFLGAPPEQTGRDVVHAVREWTQFVEVEDPFVLRDFDSPADLKGRSEF